jgi:PKD domain
MSILQNPPAPSEHVICDFFFEQTGPPGIATYDGDTYPYPPLPSDKGNDYRYAWGTTPILLAVEFFGTAHTVESKVQPHVIPPPGVNIMEYFWDFGDGFTGHGPIVTHTYEVPDPSTAISLTVIDSLGREFSTSKALSLLIVDFGYIYTRIRGKNTESPPKKQEVKASGDFALSIEGTPTRTWIERGGKPVREQEEKAVSIDRASILTHFFRSTTDTSLTSDAPTRKRELARKTTDTSLGTDATKSNVHRFAQIRDTALSTDSGGQIKGKYRRVFAAALDLLGKSPH